VADTEPQKQEYLCLALRKLKNNEEFAF